MKNTRLSHLLRRIDSAQVPPGARADLLAVGRSVHTGESEPPQESANKPGWSEVSPSEYEAYWSRFYDRFNLRTGVTADDWPAIREPAPSLTFDLSVLTDGPLRATAYDAINAEALRAFVWALPGVTRLVVLDWQHPAYHFEPAVQALAEDAEWEIPVYPDGDYYAFLTEDFSEGTFGHPWEQTLCVIGDRLINSLGASLRTWLPITRHHGA